MKKLSTLIFGMLLISSALVAQVPNASDLRSYEQEGYFVVCVGFEGEVCNDIVFAGSYNGWGTDPANMVYFSPLPGFDGWYVAVVPATDDYGYGDLRGKPVQLALDGAFDWGNQTGDVDSWELLSGTVEITAGYADEADLKNYDSSAPIILRSKYWKYFHTACVEIVEYDYTIYLKAPSCGGYEPAIIGDFNGWAEGIPMTWQGNGYYKAVITSHAGKTIKFKATTDTNWYNQIQYFNYYANEWYDLDNYQLGEETTVYIDYSTPDYKYSFCTSSSTGEPEEFVPADREHNFESSDQNDQWRFAWRYSQTNYWTIGTAAGAASGSNALYITSDGYNYGYDNYSNSEAWAYLPIRLAANDMISFSWKGQGESYCDYLQVYLFPKEAAMQGGVSRDVAIALSPTLYGQSEWQTYTAYPSVEGDYYLCFIWRNDGSAGDQPAAIDNVSISAYTSLQQYPLTYALNNDGTAAVMRCEQYYYDHVSIPETLTYGGRSYSVTAINDYAFQYCYLSSVTIPSSVNTIGNEAFYDCYFLEAVTLEATTPPAVSYNTFDSSTPIYVPCTALNTYMYANNYSYLNLQVAGGYQVYLAADYGYAKMTDYDCSTNTVSIYAYSNDRKYAFSQWSDGNTDNPRTLQLSADLELTARFSQVYYSISNLTVTPNCGKVFASWESDASYYQVYIQDAQGNEVYTTYLYEKRFESDYAFASGEYVIHVIPTYEYYGDEYAGEPVSMTFTINDNNCVDLSIYDLDYTISNNSDVTVTWNSAAPRYYVTVYDYDENMILGGFTNFKQVSFRAEGFGQYYCEVRGYNEDHSLYSASYDIIINVTSGEISYDLNFVYAYQEDYGRETNGAYLRPIDLSSSDGYTKMRLYLLTKHANSIVGTYVVDNSGDYLNAGDLYGNGSYIRYRGVPFASSMQAGAVTIVRNTDGRFEISFELTDENGNLYSGTCTPNVEGYNISGDEVTALTASQAKQITANLPNTNLTTMPYLVEGIISHISSSAEDFRISDDGTTDNQIYTMDTRWLNNQDYVTNDNIALGDYVILCGYLKNGRAHEIRDGYVYQHQSAGGDITPDPEYYDFTIRVKKAANCDMDISNGVWLWWWNTGQDGQWASTTLDNDGWYTATVRSTESTINCLAANYSEWSDVTDQTEDFVNITGDVCLQIGDGKSYSQYTLIELSCSTEEPLPCYTVSVNFSDGGYAYAYANPTRDCYYVGTLVEISAYAHEGYEFSHWSTGETSPYITISVNGDVEITAYFTPVEEPEPEPDPECYTLTLTANEGGYVEREPYKDCYEAGEYVDIQAVAYEGYVFSHWSDNLTSASRTVLMNRNMQLRAFFVDAASAYDVKDLKLSSSKLNLTIKWTSAATRFEVTIQDKDDQVILCDTIDNEDATKAYKHKVPKYGKYTVSVKPFDYDDQQIGKLATKSLVVELKYSLSISAGVGGTVNEEVNGSYAADATVEIIATAKEGYIFLRWDDGNTNATRTLTMDQDYELMALFTPNVGVENIYDGLTIDVQSRTIVVEASQSQDFALYDAVGHLISQQVHTLSAHFRVPSAGLYILRTSNGYLKIRVE